MESLCVSCSSVRKVVSGTGSIFFLCELSKTDRRFSKYPPQPVVRCDGYLDLRRVKSFMLRLLSRQYAVCRLDKDATAPDWATGEVVSITRTPDELSVVCPQDNVPSEVRRENGWRCLEIAGPLDFSMVGVIATLTGTLASANISVFVFSTFDTDYLLVREQDVDAAMESFTAAGHQIAK